MVRRYPHTAVVVSDGGSLVNGEWVPGSPSETTITGRYDPTNNGNTVKRNNHGDEVIVKAEFYTTSKPVQGVKRIKVTELGIDEEIIAWWPFQTHSIIYV